MLSPNQLSLYHLRRGIRIFRERRSFPHDLHNNFYQQLPALTTGEISIRDWSALVQHLSAWHAIRPCSKQQIFDRGRSYLTQINEKVRALDHSRSGKLTELVWLEVAPLFDCASEIKNVSSPVFPSKLCHFLRPQVYSVVDQALVGIGQTAYQHYWQECQTAWNRCEHQELLIGEVRAAIGSAVLSDYPYATKIVELCRISVNNKVDP